ncbi:MAG: type II toxin-antitoxin system VapC family toxin [Acidobacteria bacterium]|nr:type II toxin-antitoxin system VapC family toxin [Acidobacteriota bacterium]
MEVIFFDTSALAKRYIDEKGSAWIGYFFHDESDCLVYIAEITIVELASAIVRRSKGGSLSAEEARQLLELFDDHLSSQYYVLELNSKIIDGARGIVEKYGLRAYDAVQAAAAEHLNRNQMANDLPAVVLVSADLELLAAARAMGLRTEDPNDHP